MHNAAYDSAGGYGLKKYRGIKYGLWFFKTCTHNKLLNTVHDG